MKEHWEPTLEELYELFAQSPNGRSNLKDGKVMIREAWSIEAANHGDSAVLNEQTLLWGYTPVCKCRRTYAEHTTR